MQTTHCKINKLQLICFNISISFQISPVLLTPFLILKINIWRKVVDVIVEPWTRNINSLLSLFQEWIICSRNQGCILPPSDEITTPGRENGRNIRPCLTLFTLRPRPLCWRPWRRRKGLRPRAPGSAETSSMRWRESEPSAGLPRFLLLFFISLI